MSPIAVGFKAEKKESLRGIFHRRVLRTPHPASGLARQVQLFRMHIRFQINLCFKKRKNKNILDFLLLFLLQ